MSELERSIGIVPFLHGWGGGIYQYSLTMLQALDSFAVNGCEDDFVVFADDLQHPALAPLNNERWTLRPIEKPSVGAGQTSGLALKQKASEKVRRIIGEGPHGDALRWLRRSLRRKRIPHDLNTIKYRPDLGRWFQSCGVELMLYPAPSVLSFESGVPFVTAIHDLQHRLQPEFPEVSAGGEWEAREYLFRHATRKATLLLADSEVGKEDIMNFYGPYGVTEDRVKVLPFLPASYLPMDVSQNEKDRISNTYNLPGSYLFYPAQFWPHKNHERIVKALGVLKQERRLEIPIVFCGSKSGELRELRFQEVFSLAKKLEVDAQVLYLDFVPDDDIAGLYAGARALIMPTFFGPSNIPILEAWAFGCPVLTSDIRGIREQVGDAAIVIDPRSAEGIAAGIYQLWTDEGLRQLLAERGRQRLAQYTPDDYRGRLIDIVEEAKDRVRNGKR